MCVLRWSARMGCSRGKGRYSKGVVPDRQSNTPFETQLRHLETDIENPRSKRMSVVSAEVRDPRPWVQDSLRCAELSHFEISHVGSAEMIPPYSIVRRQQSGAFFMACLSGHGEVFVDGRWRKLAAGQACLLPSGIQNSFRIGRSKRWAFCWVRFGSGVKSRTIFRASSPVQAAFEERLYRPQFWACGRNCKAKRSPVAITSGQNSSTITSKPSPVASVGTNASSVSGNW